MPKLEERVAQAWAEQLAKAGVVAPPRVFQRTGKTLYQRLAEACAKTGEPFPPKPRYQERPALADDAGPVETMLAAAADRRDFAASITPPAAPGGRRRFTDPRYG